MTPRPADVSPAKRAPPPAVGAPKPLSSSPDPNPPRQPPPRPPPPPCAADLRVPRRPREPNGPGSAQVPPETRQTPHPARADTLTHPHTPKHPPNFPPVPPPHPHPAPRSVLDRAEDLQWSEEAQPWGPKAGKDQGSSEQLREGGPCNNLPLWWPSLPPALSSPQHPQLPRTPTELPVALDLPQRNQNASGPGSPHVASWSHDILT